jgi:hypothetical protein
MGWKVWADDWASGELSNTDRFQTVRVNSNDVILRYVRTWVVIINDPVFTDLHMLLYSNEVVSGDNTPKKLIARSLTPDLTKSNIHTLDHGVKEIWFKFDEIPLQKDTWYNFVINGTGYVPTASSYLCWMKAFPDPVYSTNLTLSLERLPYAPYQLYIGGGLF